jgi:hypothetical protein
MREKIERLLPKDQHEISEVNFEEIHVVDWTNTDNKCGVEVLASAPSINSVHVDNSCRVPVIFDAFGKNALPIKKGKYSRQCECVMFPSTNNNHWILFIETKYARDRDHAFRKEYDYPWNMVSQIIETVNYFREKQIIEEKQKVHAIVAFPNLLEDDYHDDIFRALEESPRLSVEKIKLRYNIIIRGGNCANIVSEKQIQLHAATK